MGGKKKSLANRLAKMSDEERGRYLQHKADLEEEARRRKEQLIAVFMKNKIRKEDAFSRLNLAKINQHWHHVLRQNKCKEMKEDVRNMGEYIQRVVEVKDRTIRKLLEELEMAEEQYLHNFQTHFTHIDQIIGSNDNYLRKLQNQYESDLEIVLRTGQTEFDEIVACSNSNNDHIKTIIHKNKLGMEENARKTKEKCLKKNEDCTSAHRIKLESFTNTSHVTAGSLWQQIASVLQNHVTQTDVRRMHLAELKRLDAESATEIVSNQERILEQEKEINNLHSHYNHLVSKNMEILKNLTEKHTKESDNFLLKRKGFRQRTEKDEKALVCLSEKSNNVLKLLSGLNHKGEMIMSLMMSCQKLETVKERVTKFNPVLSLDLVVEEKEMEEMRQRAPKMVSIAPKSPQHFALNLIESEFGLFQNMEPFWLQFNKVELDLTELKQEKRVLLEQNKHLKGLLKSVLQAFDQPTASKIPSAKRSIFSAPLITKIKL